MGMFIDLIYNLILPAAKREGVDPQSVAKAIKNSQKEIDIAEKNLRKSFADGKITDKSGRIITFDEMFPNG